MPDPARTLLVAIESEIAQLPGGSLAPATEASGRAARLFSKAFERPLPPGFALFISLHDGADLGKETRVLSIEESCVEPTPETETGEPIDHRHLWPVVTHGERLFCLDAGSEGADGEWPVVEVTERGADRVGSSFLRYLHTLMGDLLWKDPADKVGLARERCRRDPGLAEHWLDWAELLEQSGAKGEAAQVLSEGARAASPPGPGLMVALGLCAADRGDLAGARAAFEDAMGLVPLGATDEEARLDAAAICAAMAEERHDDTAASRAREVLGTSLISASGYWRGEAVRALATDSAVRADLALSVVRALVPDDRDIEQLRGGRPAIVAASRSMVRAREALERGAQDEAVRAARAAVNEAPHIGLFHAVLAEVLNVARDRGSLEEAREATRLNPALIEGWREMGDAYLETRDAARAEAAFREILRRDPGQSFGLAKLSQALLEQGRTTEALEAITAADERGGDPFFLGALRGDILAEMNRHDEAAAAYDEALRAEPEDHWALHQAALQHDHAGNTVRALELFERAMRFDREGCHQTLVDCADLLRRQGKIGDAVRLYRRAVAAVPNDPDWRQALRDAERDLRSAPN